MLISRIAGKSLGEYMRGAIFDKVGCDDRVSFDRDVVDGKEGGVVQTVTRGEDGGLVDFPYPAVNARE